MSGVERGRHLGSVSSIGRRAVPSAGSGGSIGSAGSIGSIGSAGCIGSIGSVASVGSIGSILSIGSRGAFGAVLGRPVLLPALNRLADRLARR